MAYAGLDRHQEAIATLERGVANAPGIWLLWQLLGICYSDLKRFDEAALAYEEALKCENVAESSVLLNQAMLATRLHENEQAHSRLDRTTEPELYLEKAQTRIGILYNQNRLEEARVLAELTLEDVENGESEENMYSPDSDPAGEIGAIYAAHD